VLDCVTQCSQSAAHLYEQFLQVQQIACHTGTLTLCGRDGYLELYYFNIVEWFWWDSNLSRRLTGLFFPKWPIMCWAGRSTNQPTRKFGKCREFYHHKFDSRNSKRNYGTCKQLLSMKCVSCIALLWTLHKSAKWRQVLPSYHLGNMSWKAAEFHTACRVSAYSLWADRNHTTALLCVQYSIHTTIV